MSVPQRAVQLTEPSEFLKEHPEVQFVDLLIADMNGVVRGKRIERNSLNKVFEKGINLPASLFALDITGSTVESTGLGLDIGDADRICYPIPGTLSMEPWQKRPTAQLLMTMHELEGEPFFADPREVLRQVVARFTEMELTIVAAFELEFYLIDQENVNGRPQPPRSPISGKRPQSVQVYSIDDLDEYVECLQDIIDGARAQGIPADAIVAESAPAQFEVNLNHVNDALKACDHAVLLKRLVKNIAYDHEMDTTHGQALSGPGRERTARAYLAARQAWQQHLHQRGSRAERRIAPCDRRCARDPAGLHGLPLPERQLLPPLRFAVLRAERAELGPDNRTVALRVPTGSPDAVRLEHRVAGADANPYLLLAAVLAGVHHGLTNKVEPGAPIEGNSYEQMEPSLPNNLRDALRELDESEIMAKYIDPKYIDIFVACKESELEEFEHSISDLEYNWYLHTV